MANPYIWAGLERATNDPTTIDQALAEAVTAHNDDPDAHLGAGQALESHRAAEIIDHLAESVVNDKIKRTARRYVAIVDPASEADFDTLASAIEYARGVGGGDIYLTRGTHFVSADISAPPTVGFYGDGIGETFIKSNNTTARSINFYDSLFPSSGYVLLDATRNGTNTFVFDEASNPGVHLVVGMYIRIYGTSEQFIRITAYNTSTRVATLASNITVVDGEAECEFYAGFQLTNGSSQAQMLTNNLTPIEQYFGGMSIYYPTPSADIKTLSVDETGLFTLAEPWTGTTQIVGGYLKFTGNNVINIQGISIDWYNARVVFGGTYTSSISYIESCQNVVFATNSNLGVPGTYMSCLFDCKTLANGGIQFNVTSDVLVQNCTFRALENAAYGLFMAGSGKVIGCQFNANGYTNHAWLNGRSENFTIESCRFESQDGQTIFNSTGSGTTGSPKFIANHFTFENNKTLTVQLKRGFWIANKFIFSGSGVLAFNAGGTNNIVMQNNIVGDITDAGTGNIFRDNVITNGSQFATAANSDTAMALRWREAVQLTPNSTRTLTTTIAPAGQRRTLIILTSGTTSYTLTFGTGFRANGTLATGTVTAKRFVLQFVSDGTTMNEISRTVAI